jgi:hypothetical protein
MATSEYEIVSDEIHVDQLFDGRLKEHGFREEVRNNARVLVREQATKTAW